MISSWRAKCAALVVFVFCLTYSVHSAERTKNESTSTARSTEFVSTSVAPDGKELFHREWIPNDPRAHGGDGLGPVFNESSCVSCHNQGGSGGGGVKNVDLITAFANPAPRAQQQMALPQPVRENAASSLLGALVESLTGSAGAPATPAVEVAEQATQVANIEPTLQMMPQNRPEMTPEQKQALVKQQKKELAKIHPGFLPARSVVLHRFSTNDKYEPWRLQMLGMNFGIANPADFMPAVMNQPASGEQDCEPPDPLQQAFPVPQPAASNATFQTVTTVTSTASGLSATVRVEAQAAAVALPAPNDFQISVVNETGDAEQKIQSLRNTAQISHAQGLQGQVGNFAFLTSRRNATALFGAGLIDRIPDAVIIEQAKAKYKDFPEIQGRVAKLKDNKIGRFGWKGQKATLYEFSMTACAVELGLDVPDHPQAGLPLDSKYQAKSHDMDQAECDSLVVYLRNLPAPVQLKQTSAEETKFVSAGEKQFAAVGCANCHTSKLGDVAGIYSDLLLHDMGQDLGDTGSYGVFVPNTPEEEDEEEPLPSLTAQHQAPMNADPAVAAEQAKQAREKTIGALRQEWRTPPLWGVRDSAPYLHDGRANTLEEAIAFHGGEAANSAKKYFMLKADERQQVLAFLRTMTAPEQSASAE